MSLKLVVALCISVICLLGVMDEDTRYNFGLYTCYSARFICDAPRSVLSFNPSAFCDVAGRLHDHFVDIPKVYHSASAPRSTKLEKPQNNHALRESGAVIIPQLTSPTLHLHPANIVGRTWQRLTGFLIQDPHIIRPSNVLNENVVNGECWETSAADAQIGIRLSKNISVSYISLNYVVAEQLSPSAASRAPQHVSVWGLLQGERSSEGFPQGSLMRRIDSFLQGSALPSVSNAYFIQLAKFRYNLSPSALAWQRFPVSSSMNRIPNIQTVVAKFETNKGGADTTCIYTIGIHGMSSQ